jgi:hypothetical protein
MIPRELGQCKGRKIFGRRGDMKSTTEHKLNLYCYKRLFLSKINSIVINTSNVLARFIFYGDSIRPTTLWRIAWRSATFN